MKGREIVRSLIKEIFSEGLSPGMQKTTDMEKHPQAYEDA